MFKFNLGDKVKDWVTGFVGVICCRTEWLNGCERYGLQAPLNKEGKIPDFETFDVDQLELIAKAKVKKDKLPTGGPQKDASRNFCETKRS